MCVFKFVCSNSQICVTGAGATGRREKKGEEYIGVRGRVPNRERIRRGYRTFFLNEIMIEIR